jgi:general secretion pathway protein K
VKRYSHYKSADIGSQPSADNQSGSVLVITLLLITILTALVVDFTYRVYIGTSSLSNWSNAQRASLIAKSGQSITSYYLREIEKLSYTYPGEVVIPVERDFGTDTLLTIRLVDENSKFNLNSIIYSNGRTNEKALASLKKLFEYLNINPALSLAIADWIDPDNEPRLTDSEYNAKNSALWGIGELKFIKGLDQKTFDTISPFITVHSDEKININTAKLPVLVSLSDNMTENLAKKIIYYRDSTPFEDKTHLVKVSGLETIGIQILDRITVKGGKFRVISKANVNEIIRVIESVMDTSMNIYHWREA